LPFYGDEYAALALTVEREGVTVSVFGMLMAVSEGCDLRYECVPAQVSWHGASPYTAPGSKLEPFVRAAVRWWATIGAVAFPKGENVGRPEVTFTLEELTAHLHSYRDVAAANGDHPTQTGFAAHIGCDAKTLRRELQRHDIKLH